MQQLSSADLFGCGDPSGLEVQLESQRLGAYRSWRHGGGDSE
jgi:hypothetical protein